MRAGRTQGGKEAERGETGELGPSISVRVQAWCPGQRPLPNAPGEGTLSPGYSATESTEKVFSQFQPGTLTYIPNSFNFYPFI